jgi:HSP20 family molecular chaperone IbpA
MDDRLIRALNEQKIGKPVGIFPARALRRKKDQIDKMISRRAYELFELRGRIPGHQREDWAQAESELVYPCCVQLEQSAEAITLRADLPGSFTEDQLRVSIETRQVMIEGEREISVICGHGNKAHTTHLETRIQQIFRVYDLPMEVDPSRANTIVLGSTVEIWLPTVSTSTENATSTSSVALL